MQLSQEWRNLHNTDLLVWILSCYIYKYEEFYLSFKKPYARGQENDMYCTFQASDKTFSVKSAFASHISRVHKNSSAAHLHEVVYKQPTREAQIDNPSQPISRPSTSIIEDDERLETGEMYDSVDEELFLKNLFMIYLKHQAKLLLPASVIKTITEEVQEVNDVAPSHLFSKLKEKLSTTGVPEMTVTKVIKDSKCQ